MISQERIDQYIADGHLAVKIVADSISESGKRITTFQLKYPRFIHAEAKTHRVMSNHTAIEFDLGVMEDKDLSKSAGSSRAVPVLRMIEQVRTNPAMPIHWGKNQSGMQAKEELSGIALDMAEDAWKNAAIEASIIADKMMNLGAHKQIVNRILEPFQHMHTVLTATEFDNFFDLRIHEDAQPEIYALALTMKQAMDNSEPRILKVGEWHLPYVKETNMNSTLACKISAARCCRVSYLKHDGSNPSIEEDLALFERLVGSEPLHASPLEHQATPHKIGACGFSGNLKDWAQYRKIYEASL